VSKNRTDYLDFIQKAAERRHKLIHQVPVRYRGLVQEIVEITRNMAKEKAKHEKEKQNEE